ncbi:MAG TPA: hypothetical protein VK763_08670 [Terriglobales bacterium]|jgi:hypothetical protein|nr:hypothetical protein [Terriglobales bacterium]
MNRKMGRTIAFGTFTLMVLVGALSQASAEDAVIWATVSGTGIRT